VHDALIDVGFLAGQREEGTGDRLGPAGLVGKGFLHRISAVAPLRQLVAHHGEGQQERNRDARDEGKTAE
jgi:hypothetical protein